MKNASIARPEDEPEPGIQEQLVAALSPLELHNRAPWNNVVCAILVGLSRDVVPPAAPSTDWNLFLTSIAIGLIAFITMIAHGNVARNYWSGFNVLTGIWLIVSTQVFPTAAGMLWAQVCLGILTTTIALTSLANERPVGR